MVVTVNNISYTFYFLKEYIISQHVHISKHHVVHLKNTQFYASTKLENVIKKEKNHFLNEDRNIQKEVLTISKMSAFYGHVIISAIPIAGLKKKSFQHLSICSASWVEFLLQRLN